MGQEWVEKFRSDPGARNLQFKFIKKLNNDQFIIEDYNLNGAPGIILTGHYKDSLFGKFMTENLKNYMLLKLELLIGIVNETMTKFLFYDLT